MREEQELPDIGPGIPEGNVDTITAKIIKAPAAARPRT